MTEPIGGRDAAPALDVLVALAGANPRRLGRLAGDHGQTLVRMAYEAPRAPETRPVTIEETILIAAGVGEADAGRSPARPLARRELARLAARASLVDSWTLDLAGGRRVELGRRPRIAGVINVTPDSFSDGGQTLACEAAVARGMELVAAGADWLDIGGESTRPGAAPVASEEEAGRVVPVIAALAARVGAPISVDTSKAAVARAALAAGAVVVNDTTALGDPEMPRVVAEAEAGLILMHMQGTPATMQAAPAYGDVVADVARFLRERVAFAVGAGIPLGRLVIDPGIGFGKTVAHNLALLGRLEELTALGRPILVGASRKSFLGQVLGLGVGERAVASATVHALVATRGACLVRVHDVPETRLALKLVEALAQGVGDLRRSE